MVWNGVDEGSSTRRRSVSDSRFNVHSYLETYRGPSAHIRYISRSDPLTDPASLAQNSRVLPLMPPDRLGSASNFDLDGHSAAPSGRQ